MASLCVALSTVVVLRQIIHAYLIQVGFLQASPLSLGMQYTEAYSEASDIDRAFIAWCFIIAKSWSPPSL